MYAASAYFLIEIVALQWTYCPFPLGYKEMALQNIQGRDIREWIDKFLDVLNEKDLDFLYAKTAERLQLIRNIQAKHRMAEFEVGDKVVFEHQNQPIAGTIIRLNQRTVSIHTDDHRTWRVSPKFLRKIIQSQ